MTMAPGNNPQRPNMNGGPMTMAPSTTAGSGAPPSGSGMSGGGAGGSSGMSAKGGAGGGGGAGGRAGSGGSTGTVTGGECCADGDCLCHGPDPSQLTSRNGMYRTDSYDLSTGTVFYPTDAEPPFAAVAICAGFLNTGVEMLSWGSFYASHGIVTIVVGTLPSDLPFMRAGNLLAAIEELKEENTSSSSPLSGKLAGRYGTSGYSMGGGGTTIASQTDSTLRTSVGLAAWGGDGTGVTVPTLLLCGSSDTVAPCFMSDGVYAALQGPKMQVVASGASHFAWFGPGDSGVSGEYGLAFQKVFLEGDERWKPLLLKEPTGLGSSMVTTIK